MRNEQHTGLTRPLNLKVIACESLLREVSLLCESNKNFTDVTFVLQKFHNTPGLLNLKLQEIIDKTDEDVFKPGDLDAIVLCYGLCSNAVVDLYSKKYRLVIPRCDDCISLLMGSYEDYLDYFNSNGGTYFFTPSWIENGYVPPPAGIKNPALKNYKRFTYISWGQLDFPQYEEYTRAAAEYYAFEYDKFNGKDTFLSDLLSGNWDGRFLVVPKGCKVTRDYNKILSWGKL